MAEPMFSMATGTPGGRLRGLLAEAMPNPAGSYRGNLVPVIRMPDGSMEPAVPEMLRSGLLGLAELFDAGKAAGEGEPFAISGEGLLALPASSAVAGAVGRVPKGVFGSGFGNLPPVPKGRKNMGPYLPDEPPKNLRDRYWSELYGASGGKDVNRIKLTPKRVDDARQIFEDRIATRKEVFASDYVKKPLQDAKAFTERLRASGLNVRLKMPDGPNGSIYVKVGDKGTIRFSDHAQPKDFVDGDFKTVGGYSKTLGRRHGAATHSVDPESGFTIEDAFRWAGVDSADLLPSNPASPGILGLLGMTDRDAPQRSDRGQMKRR